MYRMLYKWHSKCKKKIYLLQGVFSEASSTPAANRKTFACLMKFLTDMVPFESSSHLKVLFLFNFVMNHWAMMQLGLFGNSMQSLRKEKNKIILLICLDVSIQSLPCLPQNWYFCQFYQYYLISSLMVKPGWL